MAKKRKGLKVKGIHTSKRRKTENDPGKENKDPSVTSDQEKHFKIGDNVLIKATSCRVWWPGRVVDVDTNRDSYTTFINSDQSEFIIHHLNILAFNESIVQKSLETLKKKKMNQSVSAFLEDLKWLNARATSKTQMSVIDIPDDKTLEIQTEVQTPDIQTEIQTTKVQTPDIQTDIQTTEVQTPDIQTDIQTTEVQTPEIQTDIQTTEVQTPDIQTEIQATEVQTPDIQTEIQTTEVQTPDIQTEIQTTEVQTPDIQTEIQTTEVQTPDIQTDIQTTEVQTPDIQTDIQTTEVQTQDIQTDIQTTEVQTPDIQTDIQTTEVQTPDIQTDIQTTEVQTPETQKLDIYKANFQIPDSPTPDIQTRDIEIPDIQTKYVHTPEVHDIVTPGIQTSDIYTPDIQTSEIQTPDIQTPEVHTTNIQISDVQTPGIRTIEVQLPQIQTPAPILPLLDAQIIWTQLLEEDQSMGEDQLMKENSFLEEDHLSEIENEFQDSGSEYLPDTSDENLSDQSLVEDQEFLTKDYRVECSESDDETNSDVFPMLQGDIEVNINRFNKNMTEILKIDEDKKDDDDDDIDENIDEDEILRDKHTKGLYIKKVSKSNTTKAGRCKKINRVYNSYQFCQICNILVSNFAQHLDRNCKKHATSQEISEIRNETDKQKKTYLRLLLRSKFNHMFNLNNMHKGKGEILLERRPKDHFNVNDYGPCPKCYLWIAKRLMIKHQKCCIVNNTQVKETSTMLLTQSDIITNRLRPEANKVLVKEVFTVMNQDEIGKVVRTDPLIIQLGNVWMEKNIDNKLKRGSYTSEILRLVGRLLINLRKLKPLSNDLGDAQIWDYLKAEHFEVLAEATLNTAARSSSDDENLLKPSNAIKLGYDIKRLINFKIGMSIMNNNEESKEDAENLLKAMEIFWGTKVNKLARVLLERRKYNKRNELPLPEDIQNLTEYLKKSIAELNLTLTDGGSFQHVAEVVATRLLTYNRRRTGELQAISLEDYDNRKMAGSEVAEHVLGECTEFERKLLNSQELMTVRGKTGRGVPILIPMDCCKGLSYLRNPKVRESAGISRSNGYVFANHNGVVRAYDSLAKACKNVNLVAPERITSTNLRKYMATMTQVLDLKEQEMNWVLNHLGHTLDVHQIHYRCTSEAIEKAQIAKILLLQDSDQIGKFRNKTLQEIQLTDLVSQEEDRPTTTDPLSLDDDDDDENIDEVLELAEKLYEEDQPKAPRKTKSNSGNKIRRQGWSWLEDEEIKSLFDKYLEEGKRPKPSDIKIKMTISQQKNGLIYKRKKDDLKKKIFRMVDKINKKKV